MLFKNVLIVFLFGAVLYSVSISAPFVSDEISFIGRNEIKNISEAPSLFEKKDYDGYYFRPIPNFISGIITLAFDYNYQYYRIFNSVLHGITTALVFLCGLLLFKNSNMGEKAAFWGALLWSAMPVHDYAVIWHTDLFDRMLAIFIMTSLIFYLRNKILFSLIFFLFALLSKETALSFPIIILLHHILFNREEKKLVSGIRLVLPYLMVVLLLIILRIILFDNNLFTAEDAHAGKGIVAVIKNLFMFSGLLIFPFYLREIEQLIINQNVIFIAIVFILSLSALFYLWKVRREDRILLFLILFIILMLLPASRLFMRWYLYLPSIGFGLMIAHIIFTGKMQDKMKYFIPAALLLVYTTATVVKETEWVKQARNLDQAIKLFVIKYENELMEVDEINFLTVPSKVNDIPVMNLGVQQFVNHHLGRKMDDIEIDVKAHSYLKDFGDPIFYTETDSGKRIEHIGDNYFMLSDYKKYIKFDEAYSGSKKPKIIYLNDTESYRNFYTFTNGYFIKLNDVSYD